MPEPTMQTLGDLLDFDRGISWSSEAEDDRPGPRRFPVLRIPNVQSTLNLDNLVYLKVPGGLVPDKWRASKDTIVMVGSNGNPDRVGNAVLIETDTEFLFASFLIGARAHRRAADPRYAFHVVRSEAVQEKISRSVQGSTGLSNLSLRFLKGISVWVPELVEQRRIAEILDTIDGAIQATERLIVKLRNERSALIQDSLRTAQIQRRSNLASLLESAVDGPFGTALKTEHYVDAPGVRVIRLSNLGDGEFLDEDAAYVSEAYARALARHMVRSEDVLVASLGDKNNHPGRACQFPSGHPPAIVKADCFRLRPLQGVVHPSYLTLYLNWAGGRDQIRGIAQGVTRNRVNLTNLKTIAIGLPSFEAQAQIAELIAVCDARIRAELSYLKGLGDLWSGLASDLLSGRVRTVVS